eukprot:UN16080
MILVRLRPKIPEIVQKSWFFDAAAIKDLTISTSRYWFCKENSSCHTGDRANL